jgi:hypothetical protein
MMAPYRAFGFTDCNGPALFINHWDTPQINSWNISRWQDDHFVLAQLGMPNPTGGVLIGVLQLDHGSDLYAYSLTGGGTNWHLLRWECGNWVEVWPGFFDGTTSPQITSAKVQGQYSIYANRPLAGGNVAVMRWTGSDWVTIAITNNFQALIGYDDGNGDALFALGNFTQLDGQPYRGFARWDGTTWTDPMPQHLRLGAAHSAVIAYDDGRGPALYTNGRLLVNGQFVSGIKKWDGQTWTIVGDFIGSTGTYRFFHIFDDGRGPALYVSGWFHNINNVPCRNVCRFDGVNWEPLHLGARGELTEVLASIPTPRGNSLFAVGSFWEAGGGNAPALAQWVGCPNCYANCDSSTVPPVLNVEDFTCFINKYARNDPYANCDGSTSQPILSVEDFSCFINRFAQGCP